MSSLPQRKKSPEEIARLRESFGIPGAEFQESAEETAGEADSQVDTIVPENHEAIVIHEDAPAELPKPAPQAVHSFKRSEQADDLLPKETQGLVEDAVGSTARGPKPVRSLRKSEMRPASIHPEPPPDSNLPFRRHSDEEIADIRRREALSLMNSAPDPRHFPAHPALVAPGYLSAIAAAAGCYFYQLHIAATLALVLVSFSLAAFIGIHKPVSRHHAAFIAVISLLVLVFGLLYYFPHLRHAT